MSLFDFLMVFAVAPFTAGCLYLGLDEWLYRRDVAAGPLHPDTHPTRIPTPFQRVWHYRQRRVLERHVLDPQRGCEKR